MPIVFLSARPKKLMSLVWPDRAFKKLPLKVNENISFVPLDTNQGMEIETG